MTELLQNINNKNIDRHEPENVNQKHKLALGFQNRVAATITNAVGTMYALYITAALVFGWMMWQTLTTKPFDPFPFAFMVFLSNIIQLLLMPLLMVGQNIQGKHAELRAEEEYKMTKSLNKDIAEILQRLEIMEKKLK